MKLNEGLSAVSIEAVTELGLTTYNEYVEATHVAAVAAASAAAAAAAAAAQSQKSSAQKSIGVYYNIYS